MNPSTKVALITGAVPATSVEGLGMTRRGGSIVQGTNVLWSN